MGGIHPVHTRAYHHGTHLVIPTMVHTWVYLPLYTPWYIPPLYTPWYIPPLYTPEYTPPWYTCYTPGYTPPWYTGYPPGYNSVFGRKRVHEAHSTLRLWEKEGP